ncbi:MAG: ATP-binding protein [Bdellovibrionales bacterium]|nr:ATP-binding protein [Bdellovibrionales bacterium]
MVFLGGPRQVGKTTLCLSFLSPPHPRNPAYLNWDSIPSRTLLRQGKLPTDPILVLDEIHKFKLWRSLIKGFYDVNKGHQDYLVTGSARLDHYRKGGDSLLGRYRYLRLHPFSVNELQIQNNADLESLSVLGGFPEPFFSQSKKDHKLWCAERIYRIVNDDIADLENLKDYSRLELLAEVLTERVGSLFSAKSLEEDLQVSQKTVLHWVEILQRVYYLYRIYPFGGPKIRALKKAPKIYLWDWSEVQNPGSRFENMVAGHLLKYCHFLEDTEGEKMELRYLRDTDHREVDFVVLKNKKPLFAVECKTGDRQIAKSISYFKERTSIPKFFQVHQGSADYLSKEGVRVLPFFKFCNELGLP